jgi:hypothetical protein
MLQDRLVSIRARRGSAAIRVSRVRSRRHELNFCSNSYSSCSGAAVSCWSARQGIALSSAVLRLAEPDMFSCSPVDDAAAPVSHSGCGCCRSEVLAVGRRIDGEVSRRGFIAGVGASLASLGFSRHASAQMQDADRPIFFSNFRLFDGKSGALRGRLRVLVEAGRVKALATNELSPPDGARLIDCGGRTLMPGLIDAHWHTILAGLPVSALVAADIGYIMLAASAEAERTLMRGFTTIRTSAVPRSRSNRRSMMDSPLGLASILRGL